MCVGGGGVYISHRLLRPISMSVQVWKESWLFHPRMMESTVPWEPSVQEKLPVALLRSLL